MDTVDKEKSWLVFCLVVGFFCVCVWARSWFTPTWVGICISVSEEKEIGVHFQTQNKWTCMTWYRSMPSTSLINLTLLETTTQLSHISISSQAPFKMVLKLLLHHCGNSHQVGNHPLPDSVCNFKVTIFDVTKECQPAVREAGESSAQDFKLKAVTADVPRPDGWRARPHNQQHLLTSTGHGALHL